jgi:8-oxo-dGTP pyrophosphatase MutT (NUDIX family)
VTETVRAAGGVPWRDTSVGGIEVLLVHRPKYDDWTFPKGKRDPGETDEDCARREVEEETGWSAQLDGELGDISYVDGHGRPKIVRYWAMTLGPGEFIANDEVDEIAWLSVAEAEGRLSYPRDQAVLERFVEHAGLD